MRMKAGLSIIVLIAGAIGFGLYMMKTDSSQDSSKTVSAAIEKQRGAGSVSYIIHEHAVPDGEVAFIMRQMPDSGVNIGAEYVQKTTKGWRWVTGGSFGASNVRMGLPDSEARRESFHIEYFPDTAGSSLGDSPFPLIFGIVLHPDIARMTVTDHATGLAKQAEMVEVERNFKLYYAFVDQEQGTAFDVTGYAADGSVIHKETIENAQMFQGDTRESNE